MSTVAPPAGLAIEAPSRSLGCLMPESSRQNTACGGLAYTIETSLTGIWSLPRASTSEPASAKPTIALLAPTCRMASTDRSLAAHDLHVEIGVLVIAFLDRDEEIGVTAIVTEVGDERDVVPRLCAFRYQ